MPSIDRIRNYTRRGSHGRPGNSAFVNPLPSPKQINKALETKEKRRCLRALNRLTTLHRKICVSSMDSGVIDEEDYERRRQSVLSRYPNLLIEIDVMERMHQSTCRPHRARTRGPKR